MAGVLLSGAIVKHLNKQTQDTTPEFCKPWLKTLDSLKVEHYKKIESIDSLRNEILKINPEDEEKVLYSLPN